MKKNGEWRYSSTIRALGTRWRRVVIVTPLIPWYQLKGDCLRGDPERPARLQLKCNSIVTDLSWQITKHLHSTIGKLA
jgi:hypothetical protein